MIGPVTLRSLCRSNSLNRCNCPCRVTFTDYHVTETSHPRLSMSQWINRCPMSDPLLLSSPHYFLYNPFLAHVFLHPFTPQSSPVVASRYGALYRADLGPRVTSLCAAMMTSSLTRRGHRLCESAGHSGAPPTVCHRCASPARNVTPDKHRVTVQRAASSSGEVSEARRRLVDLLRPALSRHAALRRASPLLRRRPPSLRCFTPRSRAVRQRDGFFGVLRRV